MTEIESDRPNHATALLEACRGKPVGRKARLLACAVGRSVGDQSLTDERLRDAVVVAEQFADGLVDKGKLAGKLQVARAIQSAGPESGYGSAADLVVWALTIDTNWLIEAIDGFALDLTRPGLVCDIFDNPITIDFSWLTPLVVNLAAAIYADRRLPSGRFDNQRLAILADALEDAGCDSADLLGHLRNGGDHVRGCWAVDLLLGKE